METPLLISNIIDTDSYKFSHWKQYPPKTSAMFSYFESRGGEFDTTLFFGLQYYLRRFLSQPITEAQVKEAASFAAAHGVPFNRDGWMRIATVLDGKLPVHIRAVPEGAVIPTSNILMSVESTDPETFWVVSWLETMLVRLWYPTTVATLSHATKQLIGSYLDETADDRSELAFKLHDFGSRGVSSQESAMIGGAAHLVNFLGSDTVAGIYAANHYYDHDMAGVSIPATEHSTMTMWGRARETDAYANLLTQYQDAPIFACVSDSYDIFAAAKDIWGGALRDRVIEREGVLVIRPDSGDPKTVVLRLLDILADAFGATKNSKGFKVLDNGVRVIQGDGVDYGAIEEILAAMRDAGYSATNIAFGMGGGLLQKLNRDTQKFAFKCSWAEVDDTGVDVYKQPITDKGKRSKRGQLELEIKGRAVKTVRREACAESMLRDVYKDGEVLVSTDLDAVRGLSEQPFHRLD